MIEEKAHIITERVFGSSRKIQFINLESLPITNNEDNRNINNNNNSSFDSLLSAIEHIHPNTNENEVDLHNQQPSQQINKKESNHSNSNIHQSMSIESLLSDNNNNNNSNYQHHRESQSASKNEINVSSLFNSDYQQLKRKSLSDSTQQNKRLQVNKKESNNNNQKTIITCLHASVAQKSYGSEKRFLCPPPLVQIKSPSNSTLSNEQRSEKMQLSMSVMCENGDKILEQHSMLDENQSGSFKYLHVTGTAKAKQFNLKVDLLPIQSDNSIHLKPICSFLSKPISIISKPSKKTAKTRNVSTCILANSPISLFNRINSQTVRTKYMTSCNNMLCAKNTTWSPFDIIIVNQPKLPQSNHKLNTNYKFSNTNTTGNHGKFTSRIQLQQQQQQQQQQHYQQQQQQQQKQPIHVTYGTEIVLRDIQTGVTSPSLIIRKVDKGRIAPCAYGPVSQMQKIALQLASTLDSQPIYLSAAGSMNDNSIHDQNSNSNSNNGNNNNNNNNTWLDYSPSRLVQPEKMSLELSYEAVDDYLCWTIVGIHQFEYEFDENQTDSTVQEITYTPPLSPVSPRQITPYPLLTQIEYQPNHTLNVIGQHLIQAAPVPRLLDLWLGTHGPLLTRISQPPQPHTPHETHWSVELPSTQDLLVANHDLLVSHPNGHRTLELNLLLVRQDGVVYHTGKALSCDILNDTGRWTVVPASSSSN